MTAVGMDAAETATAAMAAATMAATADAAK